MNYFLGAEAAAGGVLYKKGVLKNFAKFTGTHLFRSLFFINVTGLTPATLLKKRLQSLSSQFCETFKNASRRLLL